MHLCAIAASVKTSLFYHSSCFSQFINVELRIVFDLRISSKNLKKFLLSSHLKTHFHCVWFRIICCLFTFAVLVVTSINHKSQNNNWIIVLFSFITAPCNCCRRTALIIMIHNWNTYLDLLFLCSASYRFIFAQRTCTITNSLDLTTTTRILKVGLCSAALLQQRPTMDDWHK